MTRLSSAGSMRALTSEGGLLPADLLARVATGTMSDQKPSDYGLPGSYNLTNAAANAYQVLQAAWADTKAAAERNGGALPPAQVWRRWGQHLMSQLGYAVEANTNGRITVDGDEFPIAWTANEHVPVHVVAWPAPASADARPVTLDQRAGAGRGASRTAPHSLLQEYLNRAPESLWGFVTNGTTLRVLRDSEAMARAAYLEVDFQEMFDGGLFDEFAVLWLLLHGSRLAGDTEPEAAILEAWRNTVITDGVRAREHLRTGVINALQSLGDGFLQHPDNHALRDWSATNPDAASDLNRWLLRLVYRLLFTFIAEDRGLLHPAGSAPTAIQAYDIYFSTRRLRSQSFRHAAGRHSDTWKALGIVFTALGGTGLPSLALPSFGSFLLRPGALGLLEDAAIDNRRLLDAIQHLAYVRDADTGTVRPIDYRNLAAEELGSVYEGLLEFIPAIDTDRSALTFTLRPRPGNERKTSGAYYTPTSVIEALLDESLDPLLDEASQKPDPLDALLGVTVCDPACGSGHFLAAAARRIARRYAQQATGDPEPTPLALRDAMRRVVGRCVYGVDLNDLAVELAKINLWIETIDPGKPLAFLDSHLKVGNALIGTTPALLAKNVPDDAFDRSKVAIFKDNDMYDDDAAGRRKAVVDAEKKAGSSWKKTNANERIEVERSRQMTLDGGEWINVDTQRLAERTHALEGVSPDNAAAMETFEDAWRALDTDPDLQRARLVADAWTSTFFQVLQLPDRHDASTGTARPVTYKTLLQLQSDPHPAGSSTVETVSQLARQYRFFHWHLEFPQIFTAPPTPGEAENPQQGWNGGFSLVLGNPPWDTLSPDRKEFLAQFDPQVRIDGGVERADLYRQLLSEPVVKAAWERNQRDLLTLVHFLKQSGRYVLYSPGNLGKGDFNVFRSFVEHALATGTAAAQVVPTGLLTGANTTAIRQALIDQHRLLTVLSFQNDGGVFFPGVDTRMRFCLYSAQSGKGPTSQFARVAGISSVAGLEARNERMLAVSVSDIRREQPETLAFPESENAQLQGLATRISNQFPVFADRPYPYSELDYRRELDTGTDQHLFVPSDEDGLPLFEGRMIDQYEYRAKAWVAGHGRSATWLALESDDVPRYICPQWRVPPAAIPAKLGDRTSRYRFVWCKVTGPRNLRTFMSALLPPSSVAADTVPTMLAPIEHEWVYLPLLAVTNSLTLDFAARQRMSGNHLTFTIMDGLPIAGLALDNPCTRELGNRVIRLLAGAPELTEYLRARTDEGFDLGDQLEPARGLARRMVRAEIDVIVARDVYGLSLEDLYAVLASFELLKKAEDKRPSEPTTKSLVAEAWSRVAPTR
jgi:hypothetical protein